MLRERILSLATEMFQTFGLKAVSMDDIAKKVGISKRTLYETFSSKDELLTCCIRNIQEKSVSEIETLVMDPSKDFVEMILGILFVLTKDMRKVNTLFFVDLDRYNFRSAFELNEVKTTEKRNKFVAMLQRGVDEGYIIPDIDLELTADIFFSNNMHLTTLLRRTSQVAVVDLVNNLFLLHFRGISTLKGVERIDTLVAEMKKSINKQ